MYPCYINSAKTGSQGRKLPVDKSVENPTTPEIYDVVQKIIKLPAEIEVRSIGLVILWNEVYCTVVVFGTNKSDIPFMCRGKGIHGTGCTWVEFECN